MHRFSPLSPIPSNHFFKPSVQDDGFLEWHRRGLVRFKDMFIDGTLASFEQLGNKYGLAPSHFFRYLQARHFILSNFSNSVSQPDTTMVDTVLSLNPSIKGLILFLYNKMLDLTQNSSYKLKTAWEEDLGRSIPGEKCTTILKLVNSSLLCARHCLIQFKVVHRAHMSKTMLSHIYPGVSPCCDKCKIAEASLIHMYWSCPCLGKYWTEVFHTLSNILNTRIDPNPLVALFGVTDDQVTLPSFKRQALSFCSLLARRAVLLKWRDSALLITHSGSMTLCPL